MALKILLPIIFITTSINVMAKEICQFPGLVSQEEAQLLATKTNEPTINTATIVDPRNIKGFAVKFGPCSHGVKLAAIKKVNKVALDYTLGTGNIIGASAYAVEKKKICESKKLVLKRKKGPDFTLAEYVIAPFNETREGESQFKRARMSFDIQTKDMASLDAKILLQVKADHVYYSIDVFGIDAIEPEEMKFKFVDTGKRVQYNRGIGYTRDDLYSWRDYSDEVLPVFSNDKMSQYIPFDVNKVKKIRVLNRGAKKFTLLITDKDSVSTKFGLNGKDPELVVEFAKLIKDSIQAAQTNGLTRIWIKKNVQGKNQVLIDIHGSNSKKEADSYNWEYLCKTLGYKLRDSKPGFVAPDGSQPEFNDGQGATK